VWQIVRIYYLRFYSTLHKAQLSLSNVSSFLLISVTNLQIKVLVKFRLVKFSKICGPKLILYVSNSKVSKNYRSLYKHKHEHITIKCMISAFSSFSNQSQVFVVNAPGSSLSHCCLFTEPFGSFSTTKT